MLEVGITYREIDLLLYTHTHPDHTADLIPILFACKYGDLPRQKEMICAGGPGFCRYIDRLRDLYGSWIEPQTYHLTVQELFSKPLLFKDMKISTKTMAHLPESVGYRIEWKDGKSVVLSGDTDYCENLITLAQGTDLLILECSFPDEKKVEGHLTPSLAGRIATESRCRRLLLTHLYPVCDRYDIEGQCRRTYQGPILIAEDLMRIEI